MFYFIYVRQNQCCGSVAYKMPTKNKFLPNFFFFAYYFLKVHIPQSSKVKSQKISSRNQGFSYLFLLFDGRICRSRWPKNIWILRIRIHNTGENATIFAAIFMESFLSYTSLVISVKHTIFPSRYPVVGRLIQEIFCYMEQDHVFFFLFLFLFPF
jgi:hypothetical protein